MLRDHATFVQTSGMNGGVTSVSLQSRVAELEAEVGQLREQLGKAKGINDTMWETVVQRLVAEGKERAKAQSSDSLMAVDNEDERGEERRRKRGRT